MQLLRSDHILRHRTWTEGRRIDVLISMIFRIPTRPLLLGLEEHANRCPTAGEDRRLMTSC